MRLVSFSTGNEFLLCLFFIYMNLSSIFNQVQGVANAVKTPFF